MLLPALNAAREKARSASCINQQKQLGLGFNMYLGDYESYYPNYFAGGGVEYWSNYLLTGGYAQKSSFKCPTLTSDLQDKYYVNDVLDDSAPIAVGRKNGLKTPGYGYNYRYVGSKIAALGGTGSDKMFVKQSEFKYPGRVFLTVDSLDKDKKTGHYRVHESYNSASSVGDIDPRHGGRANFLLGDGHVEPAMVSLPLGVTTTLAQIKQQLPNYDSGMP